MSDEAAPPATPAAQPWPWADESQQRFEQRLAQQDAPALGEGLALKNNTLENMGGTGDGGLADGETIDGYVMIAGDDYEAGFLTTYLRAL